MRLHASTSATSLSPAVRLEGLGFEFADVDEDGRTDIVTTLNNRLVALLSRGDDAFETRDFGISMAKPDVMDFVIDPGPGDAPAVLHIPYKLRACPPCGAGCSGQCIFGTCLPCLADVDCAPGRCEAQACVL